MTEIPIHTKESEDFEVKIEESKPMTPETQQLIADVEELKRSNRDLKAALNTAQAVIETIRQTKADHIKGCDRQVILSASPGDLDERDITEALRYELLLEGPRRLILPPGRWKLRRILNIPSDKTVIGTGTTLEADGVISLAPGAIVKDLQVESGGSSHVEIDGATWSGGRIATIGENVKGEVGVTIKNGGRILNDCEISQFKLGVAIEHADFVYCLIRECKQGFDIKGSTTHVKAFLDDTPYSAYLGKGVIDATELLSNTPLRKCFADLNDPPVFQEDFGIYRVGEHMP